MKQRVVAIVGPTGSGKALLAREVARLGDAELLSCDSMKVYRRMDVGTAKPNAEQRAEARWHGLDLVEPWESFNAGRFRELFEQVRGEAAKAGRPLLLSGGTMLYLKAATEGAGEPPPRDDALRERLSAEALECGSPALHERLREVDPQFAAKIHPNDARRIVRGLEVHELSGRPLSSYSFGRFGEVRPELERVVFVVERSREDMDARIDRRIDRMLEEGWLEECRALLAEARGISTEARQALGYRSIFAWLEAGEDPAELQGLAASIKTATRRFARKQLTWIRHLPDAHTLHVEAGNSPLVHLERVLEALK